jgi:amino acid transporter
VGASWLSFSNVAGWKRVISAAGLATFIDFLMEAVMVNKLRYWEWKRHSIYPGGADWMNPFGWFLVSLVACQALNFYSKPQTNNDSTEINEGRWVVGLYCVLMATLWLF